MRDKQIRDDAFTAGCAISLIGAVVTGALVFAILFFSVRVL